MRFVMNDEDWVREVKEAGSKLLCSACPTLRPFCRTGLGPALASCRCRSRAPIFIDRKALATAVPALPCSSVRALCCNVATDRPCLSLFPCWAVAVIDVYDESWGPCEMIAGHLSNFYFDMGEQYGIKFVRAQANKVPDLAEFKETAVPHFLVYLVSAEPCR